MARRDLRSKIVTSDRETKSNDCADACAGQAGGFPLMHELGLAPIETLTVNIFRCICDVYVSGSGEGWDVALNAAEKELGPIKGPEYVARVTAFVRALRIERRGKFSYLGYGCRHICNDELALMTLIKAMRMRDEQATQNILQDIILISQGANRTCQTAALMAEFQATHVTLTPTHPASASGVHNNMRVPNRTTGWLH